MAQRNIDFGTFPNDPDADAIRTAFEKVQLNFTELFSGLQDQAVISINRTPGQGTSVNSPTGNVVINADIACVTVTTTTLSLGLNGANGNLITTMDNSTTQSLTIDLPANLAGLTNANFSGTVTASAFVANSSISSSNTITATGNLTAGNVSTGILTASGNITAPTANIYANTGTIGALLLTGTLTTAAQPNITTVGTLSNLNVSGSGNSNLGNVATANFFIGDGTGISNVTAIANSVIVSGSSQVFVTLNGNVTTRITGADIVTVSSAGVNTAGYGTYTGNLTSANANLGNAVNANFFIGALYGTANAATNAAAVLSNTSTTTTVYLVGTTNAANANTSLAKVTGIYANMANNAITATTFVGSLSGAATSATNAAALLQNTSTATTVYPTFSTSSANGNSQAVINTGISANLGNNSITATTFVGALSGNATTAGTVVTAAQPNITSVGTLSALAVTANANVGNLNATSAVVASTLTSNVATGTAPLTVTSTTRVANLNVNYANVADFISVAAGTGNNFLIFANAATGNISELTSTGLIANLSNNSITATTFVGALSGAATSATTAGTVTTAAQPNITSVGTLTSLAITGNATAGNIGVNGNITAANITANTGIFTGNGSGLSAIAGANVTGTVANATFATSAGTAGTVTTAAQPNITSVGTLTSLGVNGTITGTRLISNIATGTAPLTVTSTTQVANLNVAQSGVTDTISVAAGTGNNFIVFASAATGNVNELTSTGLIANLSNNSITATTFVGSLSGAATSATTAGTVTTAAQPNITSVGTLTGLTVSGAVSITNSTAATSRTTGALIVTGGIGSNANSFFTNLNVTSNIAYVAPNGANTINSTMLNGGTLAWSGNAGQLFSITDSMTGNIFTVNDVSGIPMISVDAGGNIQFAASGGFVEYGVTTAITAAGSTQGTATALTRPINVISTVASGANGIILPTVPAGARIVIVNTSANALNVYPPSGAVVNSAATNAAYSQPAGARLEYISTSTTQWYTLNATYG